MTAITRCPHMRLSDPGARECYFRCLVVKLAQVRFGCLEDRDSAPAALLKPFKWRTLRTLKRTRGLAHRGNELAPLIVATLITAHRRLSDEHNIRAGCEQGLNLPRLLHHKIQDHSRARGEVATRRIDDVNRHRLRRVVYQQSAQA